MKKVENNVKLKVCHMKKDLRLIPVLVRTAMKIQKTLLNLMMLKKKGWLLSQVGGDICTAEFKSSNRSVMNMV